MSRKTFIIVAAVAALSSIITTILVATLLPPSGVVAAPRQLVGSPTVVTYQGYLTDAGGAPLDGQPDLHFRIYTTETGDTMVWEETHTNVTVTDGYFSVLLGDGDSPSPLTASTFSGTERWIRIGVRTIDADPYTYLPRQQIAAVPYALSADTLDGMDAAELAPPGMIVMWSGSIGSIPDGWALCDGSNGTPDLRDRFIVGAGGSYTVGTTGGEATHTLTIAEIPSHSHTITADGAHSHVLRKGSGSIGGQYPPVDQTAGNWSTVQNTDSAGSHNHGGETGSTGSGAAHENRPPYYALAYIMKLP
jgi:microcystin-dependent protein